MVKQARATLESALRVRQLDRTLTTSLPSLERTDAAACAATDVAALDACLGGGLPRGHLSELAGPPSSGRTTLLLRLLAAATRRGEIAAVVDTLDRLDVGSVAAAGVDLDRLLWIRGDAIGQQAGPASRDLVDRSVDRAVKALNLVLQAGGFGVVALDLADVPAAALSRLPPATWLRVQRTLEGGDTACVLVVPGPLARSPGGLTLVCAGGARWAGAADRSRHLAGMDVRVRVLSPRRRVAAEAALRCVADGSR